MRTIIFLNGLGVLPPVSKTRWIWNDSFWSGYNKIYLTSKLPTSDYLVQKEVDRLSKFTQQFDKPIVAGQSLGAWWAAHIACNPNSNIAKMVLWTPMGDHRPYPIFPASAQAHPLSQTANPNNTGFDKTIIFAAQYDWVVPVRTHANLLADHFDAKVYRLNGDHFYQTNHKAGLVYMKDWIEQDF